MKEFLKSDTIFNYERMMTIMNMEDEGFLASIETLPEEGREVQAVGPRSSQVEADKILKLKKSLKKLQGVIGERPPVRGDSEMDMSQDANVRVDTENDQMLIIGDPRKVKKAQTGAGGVRYEEIMIEINKKQRDVKIIKVKEEMCPTLETDRVQFQDSEEYNENKILVQEISIKALRLYLTFRIQEIENQLGVQGLTSALLNFLTNFTNVSDASIYFSQIDITNAYTTMPNIQQTLVKHYLMQGIQQVYKILGATDIVGNPVGLISNLGRGVEELYSEPF